MYLSMYMYPYTSYSNTKYNNAPNLFLLYDSLYIKCMYNYCIYHN